jgi:hypothetical protein
LVFSGNKRADALACESYVVGENGPAEVKNSFGEIMCEIEWAKKEKLLPLGSSLKLLNNN